MKELALFFLVCLFAVSSFLLSIGQEAIEEKLDTVIKNQELILKEHREFRDMITLGE